MSGCDSVLIMDGILKINVTKRTREANTNEELPSSEDESGTDNGTIKIPVASNYDIDNDYDYIMARALRSYRQHREQEKADTRRIQMRANFIKRHYPRPKTAPSSRFTAAMRPQLLFQKSGSVLIPKVDAITEVQKANASPEETDRSKKRVLQITTVNINMMESNNKAKNYLKRNQGSHPWYSYSYPTVSNSVKYVRVPHAYMSASVGERDLSSSLSSSRSSSSKSSPSHSTGRPQSAVKPQYNYDGGLFVHPKKGPKEEFVIHPDWVSESMSIQKLSLSKRTSSKIPVKIERMTKSMTWPGRRCKSAPPPKLRNPITWEAADG